LQRDGARDIAQVEVGQVGGNLAVAVGATDAEGRVERAVWVVAR
jgi:hypothetical protein